MFFLQASQKRLLNSLNPLFLVLFIYGVILVRTTFDPLWPNLVRYSDVLLPFAVYLGQRRSLVEGLILCLFASHLYSLCSAAPIGVFTTLYLVLFLVARLISYVTYANQWYSILGMMLGLSLLDRVVIDVIAAFFGHGWGLFADGFAAVPRLFLNAGVGYFIYVAMELLDRLTFKAPRVNIEMAESEI